MDVHWSSTESARPSSAAPSRAQPPSFTLCLEHATAEDGPEGVRIEIAPRIDPMMVGYLWVFAAVGACLLYPILITPSLLAPLLGLLLVGSLPLLWRYYLRCLPTTELTLHDDGLRLLRKWPVGEQKIDFPRRTIDVVELSQPFTNALPIENDQTDRVREHQFLRLHSGGKRYPFGHGLPSDELHRLCDALTAHIDGQPVVIADEPLPQSAQEEPSTESETAPGGTWFDELKSARAGAGMLTAPVASPVTEVYRQGSSLRTEIMLGVTERDRFAGLSAFFCAAFAIGLTVLSFAYGALLLLAMSLFFWLPAATFLAHIYRRRRRHYLLVLNREGLRLDDKVHLPLKSIDRIELRGCPSQLNQEPSSWQTTLGAMIPPAVVIIDSNNKRHLFAEAIAIRADARGRDNAHLTEHFKELAWLYSVISNHFNNLANDEGHA